MAGLDRTSHKPWIGYQRIWIRPRTDAGIRYAYKPGQSDTLSMSAEGLLCRQYLGWKQ